MKKTIIAGLMLTCVSPAYAILNGTQISAQEYVNVGGTCSGTIVAGKWVVTAAHCGDMTGKAVTNIDAKMAKVIRTVTHPLYDANTPRIYDVELLELDTAMQNSAVIENKEPAIGSTQSITGWSSYSGGVLKTATSVAVGPVNPLWSPDAYELTYDQAKNIGTGTSQPGDSGGACYSNSGVWGVIQGSAGQEDGSYTQSCQGLYNANTAAWILETISAWSYPTAIKGEGNLTIQIQSLNQSNEAFTPYSDGALTIESNSCNSGTAEPYQVCTVVVNGSGSLYVTGQNAIEVNKKVTPPVTPTPEENGGGGGGSTGPLGLLAMVLLAAARRFKI